MKPDWDELGETFENSKKVVIGDVDCTVEGNKQLCEEQGVKGYPTLKYYTPGDRMGEVYEGSRDLKALKAFAKSLGPPCGPAHPKRCTDEQKAMLDEFLAQPADSLAKQAEESAEKLAAAKKEHEALLEELQAKYKASDEGLKQLEASVAPPLKLMRTVLAHYEAEAAKAAPQDEAEAATPAPKDET
jgi:hypothetical protein